MIYTDGVHLITDGERDELHDFAQSIGLKRCWFQPKSHPHYDLTTERKKNTAIRAGAKLISPKELVKILVPRLRDL
jgi:hypothetical protein